MKLKVLAIGDTANNLFVLSKYEQKSHIHLINFPRLGAAVETYADNVEFFDSLKISEQVKKINSIKSRFDICICNSWEGARIAYLANLNYIIYFVGEDIHVAPFVKNARVSYLEKPIHSKNYIERRFLRAVFDNAIACVTYGGKQYLRELKKLRKDAIRMDIVPVDTEIFHEKVEPIPLEKKKFTFLSPQRQGLVKGIDVLWKALPLCNSDFEVLQVNWFDKRTHDEEKINRKFFENKPKQVKLIPMIKREDVPMYYAFADAILGQMGELGRNGAIEREAVFCKTPVLHYADPKATYLIDGEEIVAPFLPHSRNPKEIAKVIDKVVESREFRDKLLEEEYEFVNKLSNPHKVVTEWDRLFQSLHEKYKSIHRNSSSTKILIINLIANIAERLVYNRKWKRTKFPLLNEVEEGKLKK